MGVDGVALLEKARAVVKSPGVPAQAPVIEAARDRGLPVLGELELGWRLLGNEFVAVTGTNGKTTTVELIGHIHREAGLPVAVAGNVGAAVSGLVGKVEEGTTVVCEVSSFQLEDTQAFAPEAAVLLNLSPDHLDRHGTFDAYRAAKLEIFARQGNDDIAVAPLGLGVDDLGGCARRVCFGEGPGAALSLSAGELWWEERALLRVAELRLPGRHNVQNAMAAAAVCLARGIDADAVRAGLRTFAGVRHRLEQVALQRRREMGERLEGDERREHARRARRVRSRHDPPDPRRPGQGAGLHGAARAGRRALPGGVPDRRGRGPDRRGARGGVGAGARMRRPGACRLCGTRGGAIG